MPPSVIDGREYAVDRDRPATASLDWEAVTRLFRPRPALRVERTWDTVTDCSALVRHVEGLLPGNRNSGLFWAACRAVEAGADPRDLADAAHGIGLSVAEVTAVIRSATRRARAA